MQILRLRVQIPHWDTDVCAFIISIMCLIWGFWQAIILQQR